MKNKNTVLFIGIMLMLLADLAGAAGYNRACNYELRAKSQGEGISSFTLADGQVTSHGHFEYSNAVSNTTKAGRVKRLARNKAASAAKSCFDAAKRGSGIPSACRTSSSPPTTRPYGSMKRYRINSLVATAKRALCDKASSMGKGSTLRDYSIYAMVSGSGDVRRECGIPEEGNNYYTIEDGRNLNCGGSAVEAFSGYHDKSNSQMRSHIANYCRTNRNTANWEIKHYEINRNNGKIRVKYRCY